MCSFDVNDVCLSYIHLLLIPHNNTRKHKSLTRVDISNLLNLNLNLDTCIQFFFLLF